MTENTRINLVNCANLYTLICEQGSSSHKQKARMCLEVLTLGVRKRSTSMVQGTLVRMTQLFEQC